ncbi:valine--tRNA ligase [Patescibacteria group bacterium]
MDKQYKADQFENKIYKTWEKSGAFSPSKDGEPYCIIMPPPNANDPLHTGHALFVTIEDILSRYQRMKGKSVLWLPGTDHAGIETQFVFEKKLKKQDKSRFDYDRKTLYKMIWDYVEKNSEVAIEQMKKLGASADWSRKKFTLDKDIVDLVLSAFIELHEDGLVYRGLDLVNYCPKCGTSFSNLEVKHEEEKGKLLYVKYKVVGGGDITVATTRPETIFADVAIAVNPKHKRAEELKNKKVVNPLTKKEMPIIFDDQVELEFGTGMLKITPAHDRTDLEIGRKHKLALDVKTFEVDKYGNYRAGKIAGDLEGKTVLQLREAVLKKLEIEKINENYTHSVSKCYRCKAIIEPRLTKQWFIKVRSLTKKALKALKDKEVKIYGNGHDKILKHWLENLTDWNISRQIVWGIEMPVWYCNKDKSCYVVSKEKPSKCDECSSSQFVKETDTFDTWFSSAQWPVVTLKSFSGDLRHSSPIRSGLKADVSRTDLSGTLFDKFYPTAVMETGYDILPFWVMRMLMMGIYLTDEVPFKKVYLHGMVRDEKGQKMSKSKGNVINPLETVKKYGADALRMSLVMSTTAGNDSATGEGKIRGMRNLTNKIWNASRFVLEFLPDSTPESKQVPLRSVNEDKKFETKLGEIVKEVSKQLDDMKIGLAAETVYNQFWHWFCDKKIEEAKEGKISKKVMVEGLKTFLKLLHPFVPFVTEAVWEQLPKLESLLIQAKWPEIH